MSLDEVLGILEVLGAVVALALFFFFYFRSSSFREKVGGLLKFLPALLGAAASRVKDTKGVFDKHDALVVLGRVSTRIQESIADPQNKTFEDVQDEVFEIVSSELAVYAGMPGVPDLDDSAIRTQVQVIFAAIQAVRDGNDTTRNNN